MNNSPHEVFDVGSLLTGKDSTALFFCPKDVARIAGCAPKAVYRAMQDGALQALRINARVSNIPRACLLDWLVSCRLNARMPVNRMTGTGTTNPNGNSSG